MKTLEEFKTVENQNILIAEFMNYPKNKGWYTIGENKVHEGSLRFHNDWNRIMEVINKIESLDFLHYKFTVATFFQSCYKTWGNANIESVHKALVIWIDWYTLNY